MFFHGWPELGRTVIVAVLAYIALVFILRVSGKRTLSDMDVFDFVITTALGSTLAQTVLSREVVLANAVLAFAALVGLQHLAVWLSMKSKFVRRLIKSEPRLLFYRGEFLKDAMKSEHVPEIEILAAVREHGFASMEDVEAVILEADSDFSVVRRTRDRSDSALADVARGTS